MKRFFVVAVTIATILSVIYVVSLLSEFDSFVERVQSEADANPHLQVPERT